MKNDGKAAPWTERGQLENEQHFTKKCSFNTNYSVYALKLFDGQDDNEHPMSAAQVAAGLYALKNNGNVPRYFPEAF